MELIQVLVYGSIPTVLVLKLLLRNLSITPLLRVFAHLSCSLFKWRFAELLHLESEDHAAEGDPVLVVRNWGNKRRCFRHGLVVRLFVFGLVPFRTALVLECVVEILRHSNIISISPED